ncbi:hypothetical protein TRFO_01550 [Tritrichomonas foetus]|uniref:Uncharacterized protein n=1 Tax=Tritrichomonas foetus TaxID=1144522 RepID=A0A1J4JXG2_9EUKA|nr:hypothetical protein TRFO_01550 [Tritrichomonas foetus]|eukprot:OHT03841.1 hypothetical protein TRFO_01550 [Tritrichomonas foetus]
MPPRKKVPRIIWEMFIFWTPKEAKEYVGFTESQQDSYDVYKYLKARGRVPTTMYDEIVSRQMVVNPKKKKFTLKQFRVIFKELKENTHDVRIKNRTHLVLRNEKMMKIFLEDFKDDIRLIFSQLVFNGTHWVKENIINDFYDSEYNDSPFFDVYSEYYANDEFDFEY